LRVSFRRRETRQNAFFQTSSYSTESVPTMEMAAAFAYDNRAHESKKNMARYMEAKDRYMPKVEPVRKGFRV